MIRVCTSPCRPGAFAGTASFWLLILFTLIGLTGARADGDPVQGEQVYARCGACHSLDRNRTGPRHCGLMNRPAGSVPGFDYSPAMLSSGLVWDAETLDGFLASPLTFVPGTKMGYAGVKNAQDRADLIAFFALAVEGSDYCP